MWSVLFTRLLKATIHSILSPCLFIHNRKIHYYFKTVKQKVTVDLKKGTVAKSMPYFVTTKRTKGWLTNVVYEDIRLRPSEALVKELFENNTEDFIARCKTLQSTYERPENSVMVPEDPLRTHDSQSRNCCDDVV